MAGKKSSGTETGPPQRYPIFTSAGVGEARGEGVGGEDRLLRLDGAAGRLQLERLLPRLELQHGRPFVDLDAARDGNVLHAADELRGVDEGALFLPAGAGVGGRVHLGAYLARLQPAEAFDPQLLAEGDLLLEALGLGGVGGDGQEAGLLVVAVEAVGVDELADVVDGAVAELLGLAGLLLAEAEGGDLEGESHEGHGEAGVAAASAEAGDAVFEDGDAEVRVGALEVVGAGDAAEAAADDGVVHLCITVQGRALPVVAGGGEPEGLQLVVFWHLGA